MTLRSAGQLDLLAHELRNQVNVLSLGAGLVDDPELGADLRSSVAVVRRVVERLVVLARIDLDLRPEDARLTLAQLIDLATARARREGLDVSAIVVDGDAAATVLDGVPGVWAERLVTDLLHAHAGTATTRVELPGDGVLHLSQQEPSCGADDVELRSLVATCTEMAAALGARVEFASVGGARSARLVLSAGS